MLGWIVGYPCVVSCCYLGHVPVYLMGVTTGQFASNRYVSGWRSSFGDPSIQSHHGGEKGEQAVMLESHMIYAVVASWKEGAVKQLSAASQVNVKKYRCVPLVAFRAT